MKKNLISKGYVNIKDNRTLALKLPQRVYEIDGIDCICLKGRFTANGVESWFYDIKQFEFENNVLVIPEYIKELPKFRLKNCEINSNEINFSVDTEKENQYLKKI